MSIDNPESFDDVFGDGAIESLIEACTFKNPDGSDDVPSVVESIWDVDGQHINWPPQEGRYIMLMASWEFVSQPSYYSVDGKSVYYSDGFCNAGDDGINFTDIMAEMQKMASRNSSSSDTPYISWIYEHGVENIYMPMPIEFQPNFEYMGWDIDEAHSNDRIVTMTGNTDPEGKVRRFLNWVSSEFSEDLKPEWIE